MNSGISKTSDLHRLLLNPLDKINTKRSDEYVALSNLRIYGFLSFAKNVSKNLGKNVNKNL